VRCYFIRNGHVVGVHENISDADTIECATQLFEEQPQGQYNGFGVCGKRPGVSIVGLPSAGPCQTAPRSQSPFLPAPLPATALPNRLRYRSGRCQATRHAWSCSSGLCHLVPVTAFYRNCTLNRAFSAMRCGATIKVSRFVKSTVLNRPTCLSVRARHRQRRASPCSSTPVAATWRQSYTGRRIGAVLNSRGEADASRQPSGTLRCC
jgi:hypothetical protein